MNIELLHDVRYLRDLYDRRFHARGRGKRYAVGTVIFHTEHAFIGKYGEDVVLRMRRVAENYQRSRKLRGW